MRVFQEKKKIPIQKTQYFKTKFFSLESEKPKKDLTKSEL